MLSTSSDAVLTTGRVDAVLPSTIHRDWCRPRLFPSSTILACAKRERKCENGIQWDLVNCHFFSTSKFD